MEWPHLPHTLGWQLEESHVIFTLQNQAVFDSVMLDAVGHIKVADFVMCNESVCEGTTFRTSCGTLDYIAQRSLLIRPQEGLWVGGHSEYCCTKCWSGKSLCLACKTRRLYPQSMPEEAMSICRGLRTRHPDKWVEDLRKI